MKTKEQELKEELNRIKGLVQNLEGKIEALELEKEDKFAELKEAYKNGAVIQCKINGNWKECRLPMWFNEVEYRIKPEEKPKVGDVCKFWNDDAETFVIGVLDHFHSSICRYSTPTNDWYKNAKKLTKQEAIELLFGSED